jgi:hypothetical protein
MRASAMSIRITPEAPAPLFGSSNRPESFAFVASELEANFVVLPGRCGLVVLAALDTLFASRAFKAAVLKRLAASQHARIQDLIFIASHTHFAPALDPTKPRLGKVDDAYFELAAHRVADALSALVKAETKSVKMTLGKTRSTLNASRRSKGIRLLRRPPFIRYSVNMVPCHRSIVPRDISVIVAKDDAGFVRWVLWHWACHATAAPEQSAISSDYPGGVRASLRRHFNDPDLPVLFFPGFCGDIRPDQALWPINPWDLVICPLQRPFGRPTVANFRSFCDALSRQIEAARRGHACSGVVRRGERILYTWRQ